MFDEVSGWVQERYDYFSGHDACYVQIVFDDPELLKEEEEFMMRRHVSQQPLYLKKDGEYVEVMPMIYCPFCDGLIEEEELPDEPGPKSDTEECMYKPHKPRSPRIVMN